MIRRTINIFIIAALIALVPCSCGGVTIPPVNETEQEGNETGEEDSPQPGQPEEPVSDGIVRILAIGNSFSQDAVEQYLYELFDAAGQKVIIGNLYIGGCTLETHYANMLSGEGKYYYRKIVDGVRTETASFPLLRGLKDEKWDYVSLQQASGLSGLYDTYSPYLPGLISYVKENVDNPSLKLMFHQTWAYASGSNHSAFPTYGSDQMQMYQAIMSASKSAVDNNPDISILIPSGTAIQNARTSFLGDSFNRDGYHLETTYGRYTAACTWFESISGTSVVGNTYAPQTIGSQEKAIAQNAAHTAVLSPWTVTEMTDFKTPASQGEDLTETVCIDFGGGTSTPPSPWTRVASYKTDSPIFLKYSSGDYAPVYISSLSGFTGTFNGVGSEPDSPVETDGLTFPKAVWSDAILVGGTAGGGDVGPASVTFAGFNPSSQYRITVLAVRYNGSADARKSEYYVKGASVSAVQSIKPGLKTFTSVEDYGEFKVVFSEVKPSSDGTIVLNVKGLDTKSAAEGHISAVLIDKE